MAEYSHSTGGRVVPSPREAGVTHAGIDDVHQRISHFLVKDTHPRDLQEARRRYDELCLSFGFPDGFTADWVPDSPVPLLEVRPTDARVENVVVFFHGGGNIQGSAWADRDWGARLSGAADAVVYLVDYRLCPEATILDALHDAISAYDWVVREHPTSPVTIAGESAGATMCLSLLQLLRDRGKGPLPLAAALTSPVTDRSSYGETFLSNAATDPVIAKASSQVSRAYVLEGCAAESPYASPLLGDMTGLPPLLVQVSGTECLLDDSLRLIRKAALAGVRVEAEVVPGVVHVWPLYASMFPEGQRAVERAGSFLQSVSRSWPSNPPDPAP